MRLKVSFLVMTAAALAVAGLSGCAVQGCSTGGRTPSEAVQGLIELARTATEPSEICRFIATGWVVSKADVQDLKTRYAAEKDSELRFVEGSQMGTESSVKVKSADGSISDNFFVTSDDHLNWTVVNIGTLAE